MKITLFIVNALISIPVLAQSQTHWDDCLKTMVKEEFEGRKKGVLPKEPVSLKTSRIMINGELSKKYGWDPKLEEAVLLKSTSNGSHETVWDPRVMLKDGDGRVNVASLNGQKISSEDLKLIQTWYMKGTPPTHYLENPADKMFSPGEKLFTSQVISFDNVYAACENVSEVKVRRNGQELELGAAALKGREMLREKYPHVFKSKKGASPSSGSR